MSKEQEELTAQKQKIPEAGNKEAAAELSDEASGAKLPKAKAAGEFIWTFISTFLTAVVVVIALALVLVRITGCSLYTIESASMAPQYPVGAIVLVKPADFDEIETGDVITYVLNEEGTLVTHRIVAIDEENQKFTTQGDNNDNPDAADVLYANVVGKVIFCLPKAGYAADFVSEHKTLCIAIAAAFIILCIVLDIVQAAKNKKNRRGKKQPKNEPLAVEKEVKTDGKDEEGA